MHASRGRTSSPSGGQAVLAGEQIARSDRTGRPSGDASRPNDETGRRTVPLLREKPKMSTSIYNGNGRPPLQGFRRFQGLHLQTDSKEQEVRSKDG